MGARIQFMEISKTEWLTEYREQTRKYIDVDFPEDYLSRSKVIAIVSDNHVIGGYVIANQGPFRVLEQLPQDIVNQNDYLQERLHKTLEITGLWIHPMVKSGRLRCRFWLQLFASVIFEGMKGRSYYVYSYDSSKKKLGEIYSVWKPMRIFQGNVFLPGMAAVANEIVEIASLKSCVFAFFTRPLFMFNRLFRRKKSQRALAHG